MTCPLIILYLLRYRAPYLHWVPFIVKIQVFDCLEVVSACLLKLNIIHRPRVLNIRALSLRNELFLSLGHVLDPVLIAELDARSLHALCGLSLPAEDPNVLALRAYSLLVHGGHVFEVSLEGIPDLVAYGLHL